MHDAPVRPGQWTSVKCRACAVDIYITFGGVVGREENVKKECCTTTLEILRHAFQAREKDDETPECSQAECSQATAGAAGSADADAVAAAVKPVSAVPAQHRPPPAAESVAAAAVNVAAAAVKPVDDGQPAVPAKVKKARVDNPLVDAHPPSSSLETEILVLKAEIACLGGEVERLKGFLASAGYDHDTGEGLAQGSGDDYETGEGLAPDPDPAQESRDQETTMTQERVDAHPKKVWLADRVVVHFECSICKGVQSAVIYYPKGDNNKAIRYSLLSLSLFLSLLFPQLTLLSSLSLSLSVRKRYVKHKCVEQRWLNLNVNDARLTLICEHPSSGMTGMCMYC